MTYFPRGKQRYRCKYVCKSSTVHYTLLLRNNSNKNKFRFIYVKTHIYALENTLHIQTFALLFCVFLTPNCEQSFPVISNGLNGVSFTKFVNTLRNKHFLLLQS